MTQRIDQTTSSLSRNNKISTGKATSSLSNNKKTKSVAASTAKKPNTPANDPIAATVITSNLSEVERRKLIAEAAYLRAQNRGFSNGNDLEDWLLAESEINARFP